MPTNRKHCLAKRQIWCGILVQITSHHSLPCLYIPPHFSPHLSVLRSRPISFFFFSLNLDSDPFFGLQFRPDPDGNLQLHGLDPSGHGQADSTWREITGVLLPGSGFLRAPEAPRLLYLQLGRNGLWRRRIGCERERRASPGPALLRFADELAQASTTGRGDGGIGRESQLRAHEERWREMWVSKKFGLSADVFRRGGQVWPENGGREWRWVQEGKGKWWKKLLGNVECDTWVVGAVWEFEREACVNMM